MSWRIYAIIVIMILCFIDLSATYYYVNKYKKWQPNKPYNLIEMNPLLRFLWNNFGLTLGMLIGAVILLAINYLVIKFAHWSLVLILFLILIWAMFNHFTNINLLHKLIEQYPLGTLPGKIFGNVVGNN